jgi:signal transduction histidine kinase
LATSAASDTIVVIYTSNCSGERALQDLEYRLQLEKLISEISQHFLSAYHHQISQVIDITLQRMGIFAGADRSYVFFISEDRKSMSNTHEWCAPGIPPQMDILQELPLADFPWIIEELERGRYINITSLDDLPAEAKAEKEILEIQDVQSLAIVPMRYGGILKGYMGFDSTQKRSQWNKEDLALLRTVGDTIISAFMRNKLEENLLQSQKMDALGRLAGGIAHDFNNILASVKGNIQLLESSTSLKPVEREMIRDIHHATETGVQLTRKLLAMSRKQEVTPEIIDLNSVIRESSGMLKRLIKAEVNVSTILQPELFPVFIDSSNLEQVIMNLVINGADAMENGGTITLRTRNVTLPAGTSPGSSTIRPGSYVLFQVQDGGHGMDPSTMKKALEPFFTTKKPENGTGLGLPTVYAIVQQAAGYLEIYSSPGHGTRIDIYFPAKKS